MKLLLSLIALTCSIASLVAEDVRLDDLEPTDAQQIIESKDQTLKYAPKVDSNVPAVRYLGNEPHNVLEDIYLANQYHGQDGLGGYLYGYSVPDIAKTEKKKAGGDLRGAYNYIAGNGQEIKVEYWDDGTGFHQIDNVPRIQPEDLPDVKAAKEEHLRLWHEQAERNSHPVQSPYNADGEYASGPLSKQGQLERQKLFANQPQGQYSQQVGQYQQPQQNAQQFVNQYKPSQPQQQGGQYGLQQGHQSSQFQQPGQQAQGSGQYQGPGQQQGHLAGQSSGQYQGSGAQATGQYQGSSQSTSGQYQAPGSQGYLSGQSSGQYQGSTSGQYQAPGSQGHLSGQSSGQYQGSTSGQSSGQYQGSASGQYQAPGSQGHLSGQSSGQYQGSASGQYQAPGSQGHLSGQSSGQYQGSASGQHQGVGQSQSSGAYQGQQASGQYQRAVQNDEYSGQYSENRDTYSQSKQQEEDEEEKGPPRGFFYNFDYPVGIIVQKQGKVGGGIEKREGDVKDVYATNKALFEGQLRGQRSADSHGSASSGYLYVKN